MANPLRQLGRWIASSGLAFWQRPAHQNAQADSRHRLGAGGERLAAGFLRRLGYRIIAQGYRERRGEIDIIAVDGSCVVFVEVKTWRRETDADPSAAVHHAKQGKITRAALRYLKKHRLLGQPARFDVIAVVWDGQATTDPQIRHYQHAFEAIGHGQLFR